MSETLSIKNKTLIFVPPIDEKEIKLLVGAGDAFNAGLIKNFFQSSDISNAVEKGVNIAQKFIKGEL